MHAYNRHAYIYHFSVEIVAIMYNAGAQPSVVPGGRPPAIRMFAPATYEDSSSLHSQQIALAISSGVPALVHGRVTSNGLDREHVDKACAVTRIVH